jgi:hypothetical protein
MRGAAPGSSRSLLLTRIEYDRYTLGIEAEGAELMTDVGKYVVIHETRGDGSTKILLDCFNSNSPLPT